ncbi:Sec-independent protein translocase protein TatB [Catenovulum sp. 2E275]|uniref:Sec-independent protein translocase protein TatB n=1 Tax=Catenovulum sp. 2E275 TaxID=2980497 RepID=UPI0021D3DE49|nr:Sec-independent protein translocase protein TatB [Catenovulum sp. 2E275]MCU4675525.1 Sec-independent protein translocase protein TatB [Catenovulum sp. 2E275]
MLDIGFWELALIAVLALLVLGPERLPSAIRSVSQLIRSVKQTANNLKSELNHELRVSELHEQLKQAEAKGMQNLTSAEKKAVSELEEAARSVNASIQPQNNPAESNSNQTKENKE